MRTPLAFPRGSGLSRLLLSVGLMSGVPHIAFGMPEGGDPATYEQLSYSIVDGIVREAVPAFQLVPAALREARLAPVAVKAFYEQRDNQPIWASDADFEALLRALDSLADHGLNPDHYRREELVARRSDRVARDVVATDAWFSAAAHMVDGKVDPVSVEPDWTAARRTIDLQSTLSEALTDGRIAESLKALAPSQPSYARLVNALRAVRLESELPSTQAEQAANRIRIDQLRVNLERWRWLPDDLGRRHIRANIANFRLEAWEDGAIARTHRIIVGKLYRKTPVFSSSIRYLVLNPWWETPPRLARVDKLKVFKRDPGAVRRLGFEVLDQEGLQVDPAAIDWNRLSQANFPYRLRQAPGEQNALGKVKIMFPNRHNVYLHDTPTRELFNEDTRAFSSGCLRTENPLELAQWLLQSNGDWDGARIDRAIESGKVMNVTLGKSVPVHVLYFTVVNAEDGGVRYLHDIYERDQRVLESLQSKPSAPVRLRRTPSRTV